MVSLQHALRKTQNLEKWSPKQYTIYFYFIFITITTLAKQVGLRISMQRGNAKSIAVSVVAAHYGLEMSNSAGSCKERAEALLLNSAYIFPEQEVRAQCSCSSKPTDDRNRAGGLCVTDLLNTRASFMFSRNSFSKALDFCVGNATHRSSSLALTTQMSMKFRFQPLPSLQQL